MYVFKIHKMDSNGLLNYIAEFLLSVCRNRPQLSLEIPYIPKYNPKMTWCKNYSFKYSNIQRILSDELSEFVFY